MLNFALALLSSALLIFSFPRFNQAWLAPVALTPLLIAVARELSARRRFFMGWAAGIVYWFGVCYWIQIVLAVHGNMSAAQAWAMFVLFCLAKGLHMAVFALLAGILMRRWWAIPAVSALWVALEVTHGPLGFAWLTLGNAATDMGTPMRLAPITGVYGISFVFMMMSGTLAVAALRRPRLEMLWLAIIAVLLVLPPMPASQNGHEAALLVQSDIPEEQEWNANSLTQTIREQVALTMRAASQHSSDPPSIVVWPEVPAPYYYEDDPGFREYIDNLARLSRAYVLFGSVAHAPGGAPLNSAELVSPAGREVRRYDKVNLVPFGEFVPWPFDYIASKVSSEVGDFAAGRGVVVPAAGTHRIGTFICYESVFPNFVRKFVDDGAEVLFNISNDGWFGQSAARPQHLNIVRMRAAENRRWILRATNDGITANIDPAGRVRGGVPSNTRAAYYTHFNYIAAKTMYTRFGDWFPALCALLATLGLVASALPPAEKGVKTD